MCGLKSIKYTADREIFPWDKREAYYFDSHFPFSQIFSTILIHVIEMHIYMSLSGVDVCHVHTWTSWELRMWKGANKCVIGEKGEKWQKKGGMKRRRERKKGNRIGWCVIRSYVCLTQTNKFPLTVGSTSQRRDTPNQSTRACFYSN